MKSTYHLIGDYWDHKPCVSSHCGILNYEPGFLGADEPPCLFDFIEKKRRVQLTVLWEITTDEELKRLATPLAECDTVAIVLDYTPVSRGSIHLDFYWHRVQQAQQALQSALPNATVFLMRKEAA